MKLKDLITEITESTFRVTFDIEDAKLGRYTTDVEAKDKKEAEKIVAAKFVGGAKLITKGKTKKIKEGMNEGQKKRASDILRKFDMAYIKFSQEVRDVMKLMDKSTGNKTDSRIINKAYGKHLIPFDDIMQSWARGQQNNPKIDEGPQRDMNNLALYIIDLNNMLSNAKILAKKDPKAKMYIKLLQKDIKDAKKKLAKIKKPIKLKSKSGMGKISHLGMEK